MIFCESNERALLNVRCTLFCFEVVSSLRINMAKSELAMLGDDRDMGHMASILECKKVNLPIRYLCLPLEAKFKNIEVWDHVVNRFETKLIGWKRGLLSKKEGSLKLKALWLALLFT